MGLTKIAVNAFCTAPLSVILRAAVGSRRALASSRDYFRQNPGGGIPFEQVVTESGPHYGSGSPPPGRVKVHQAERVVAKENGPNKMN